MEERSLELKKAGLAIPKVLEQNRLLSLFDKTDIGNGPMPDIRINFLYYFIFIHKQVIHIDRVHDGNDDLFILKI